MPGVAISNAHFESNVKWKKDSELNQMHDSMTSAKCKHVHSVEQREEKKDERDKSLEKLFSRSFISCSYISDAKHSRSSRNIVIHCGN